MSLVHVLAEFRDGVAQCDSLIANAHRVDANGVSLFHAVDRQQITIAAFLNMYIAWESFIESSLAEFMTGSAALAGRSPVRYVFPRDRAAAKDLVIGVMRFFDYANHQHVRKVVRMYFEDGYPYEPHLSAIYSEPDDLRTMRNSCAHISSTTQTALEALALRILGRPQSSVNIYSLLTTAYPGSATGETVYMAYRNKLLVAAELISQG